MTLFNQHTKRSSESPVQGLSWQPMFPGCYILGTDGGRATHWFFAEHSKRSE